MAQVLDAQEREDVEALLMDVWPFECAVQRAEVAEDDDGSVTISLGAPGERVPCSLVLQRLRSGMAGAEPGIMATRQVYVRLPLSMANLPLRSRVHVYVRGRTQAWGVYDVDALPVAEMASVLVPVKDIGDANEDFTS